MRYHTLIKERDLEKGAIYAVVFMTNGGPLPTKPLRPLQAVWDGLYMELTNPDHPRTPIRRYGVSGLAVLGYWGSRPHPAWGTPESRMTWQGVAAAAYGQVLRQRALVDRLAKFGIVRVHDPYLLDEDSPNAVSRSLQLNYDELDDLLGHAEK